VSYGCWRSAAIGDVFNVGSLHEISINDLAAMVLELTGSGSRIVHVPYSEVYEEGFEDLPRRMPDTTKVNSLTGWHPQRSLHDIVVDGCAAATPFAC
jgi:UDP-glucose 4-epimerase